MTVRTAIDTRAKILMAFWHRGRRQSVPMLATEVSEKTGISMYGTRKLLNQLEESGLVISQKHVFDHGYTRIFHLSAKGEDVVMKAVQHEARVTASA